MLTAAKRWWDNDDIDNRKVAINQERREWVEKQLGQPRMKRPAAAVVEDSAADADGAAASKGGASKRIRMALGAVEWGSLAPVKIGGGGRGALVHW
eukprot:4507490-Pyramimonas_sp.AAC.1